MLKVIGIVALLTIRANSSPVDRSRLGKSLWPFVASDSPGSEDGEGLRVWKFVPDDGQIPAEFLDLRPNERSRIWRVKIPAVDPKAIQPEVKQQNLGIRQDDEFSGYFIGPVVPVSLDQAIISSTEAVDLSFLDDLGGLAPFLPDPHQDPGDSFEDRLQLLNSSTAGSTSSRQDSQASPSYSFLRWLLSKLTFGLVGETPASSQSPTPAVSSHQLSSLSSSFVQENNEK